VRGWLGRFGAADFLDEEKEGEDCERAEEGGGKADSEFAVAEENEGGDGEIEDAGRAVVSKGVVVEREAVAAIVLAGREEGESVPAEPGFVGMEADGDVSEMIGAEGESEEKDGEEKLEILRELGHG